MCISTFLVIILIQTFLILTQCDQPTTTTNNNKVKFHPDDNLLQIRQHQAFDSLSELSDPNNTELEISESGSGTEAESNFEIVESPPNNIYTPIDIAPEIHNKIYDCIEPTKSTVCSKKGDCINNQCVCNKYEFYDDKNNTYVRYRYSGHYCEECPYCRALRCEKYVQCVECHLFSKFVVEDCNSICPFQTSKRNKVERDVERDEKLCEVQSLPSGCFVKFKYYYNNREAILEYEGDAECMYGSTILTTVFWVVIAYLVILMIIIPRCGNVTKAKKKLLAPSHASSSNSNFEVFRLMDRTRANSRVSLNNNNTSL